jgi:hypothetical protein
MEEDTTAFISYSFQHLLAVVVAVVRMTMSLLLPLLPRLANRDGCVFLFLLWVEGTSAAGQEGRINMYSMLLKAMGGLTCVDMC